MQMNYNACKGTIPIPAKNIYLPVEIFAPGVRLPLSMNTRRTIRVREEARKDVMAQKVSDPYPTEGTAVMAGGQPQLHASNILGKTDSSSQTREAGCSIHVQIANAGPGYRVKVPKRISSFSSAHIGSVDIRSQGQRQEDTGWDRWLTPKQG